MQQNEGAAAIPCGFEANADTAPCSQESVYPSIGFSQPTTDVAGPAVAHASTQTTGTIAAILANARLWEEDCGRMTFENEVLKQELDETQAS